MNLTVADILKVLSYNEITGVFTWIAKTSDRSPIKIGQEAGSISKLGYKVIWLYNKEYKASQLAWFIKTGKFEKEVIFLDGNRSNCAYTNLDVPFKLSNEVLTQDNLKVWFHYNTVTGSFTRKVSFSAQAKKGSVAGGITKNNYILIPIGANRYYAHRLAFLYMTGKFPVCDVDHINGNTLDNSWGNLRNCNKSENLCNQKLRVDNKTGHKGVYFREDRRTYTAKITKEGKVHRLGTFKTKEEAVKEVEISRIKLHKEFTNHGN